MLLSTSILAFIFILIPAVLYANAQTAAELAYTPHGAPCNVTQFIRLAGSGQIQIISPQELNYVTSRRNNTIPSVLQAYLINVQTAASSQNVLLPPYITSIHNGSTPSTDLPTLGIAISGGGIRAAMFGGGILDALDGRNQVAVSLGTGGLLQVATYMVGMSGSSLLIGSLAQADFPTVFDLILGPSTSPLTSSSSTDSSNSTSGSANSTANVTTFDDFGGWNTQFGFFNPSPTDGCRYKRPRFVRDERNNDAPAVPLSEAKLIASC